MWKPKICEWYFFIDTTGKICEDYWSDDPDLLPIHKNRYTFGNMFQIYKQAQIAAKKIKGVLKGKI